MSEGCPFEQAARAAECPTCIDKHGSLSPCVRAWLESRVGSAVTRPQIIALAEVERHSYEGKRAA